MFIKQKLLGHQWLNQILMDEIYVCIKIKYWIKSNLNIVKSKIDIDKKKVWPVKRTELLMHKSYLPPVISIYQCTWAKIVNFITVLQPYNLSVL